MAKNQVLPVIIAISPDEQEKFDKLIKSCRSKHIRTSQEIVDKIFKEQPVLSTYKTSKKEMLVSLS